MTAFPVTEVDAHDQAMVCTGCGTTQTIAAIRTRHPHAIACCPERHMVPVRFIWWHWMRHRDEIPGTPPGWQGLLASVEQIKEILMADQATLDRITAAVAAVGASIQAVADGIRNHPAAQDDSGTLNSLAASLEQEAQSLQGIADSVNNPAGAAPAGGAPDTSGSGAPAPDQSSPAPDQTGG